MVEGKMSFPVDSFVIGGFSAVIAVIGLSGDNAFVVLVASSSVGSRDGTAMSYGCDGNTRFLFKPPVNEVVENSDSEPGVSDRVLSLLL